MNDNLDWAKINNELFKNIWINKYIDSDVHKGGIKW